MAIQTLRLYHGTTTTLVSSGSALSSGSMSAESSALGTTQHSDYPMGEFELAVAYGTAPTVNTTIDLYRRDKDIANSNASPEPTTTYLQKYVGSFVVYNQTATQYLKLDAPLGKDATYYVHNNGTGQQMSSAWTLKVRPFGYGS